MSKQHFEEKNAKIQEKFDALKKASPERFQTAAESLVEQLGIWIGAPCRFGQAAGQGRDVFHRTAWESLRAGSWLQAEETLKILGDHGIKVSGVCGMFSADNDLSSNRPGQRQAAISYLQREVPFTEAVGGSLHAGGAGGSGPSGRLRCDGI